MLALVGLVGNLSCGSVVVHRLGRRHIGVRPFETERNGGQIEKYLELLGEYQADSIYTTKVHKKKIERASAKKEKGDKKTKIREWRISER